MKKICLLLMIGVLTMPGVANAQNTTKSDSVIVLGDKTHDLYLRLAQISLANKDYKSVVAYADSALARNKSVSAYRLKGLGQFNLGLYAETIISMTAGIDANKLDNVYVFELNYYRGLAYHKSDSILYAKQIAEDMTEALRFISPDTMAYYYRGLANYNLSFLANYKKDDKLRECISDLSQFLKSRPDFTAYQTRGLANFLLGGSDEASDEARAIYYIEAIKDLTECLSLQPGDEDCLYYRGLSYYISGDFINAIKDAQALKSKKNTNGPIKGLFGRK
ncbi:MAG: hypothetical protein WC523_07620 [Patescibacteria group bacterium]